MPNQHIANKPLLSLTGTFIATRRKELGLDQRALAALIGDVSVQFISDIERGTKSLPEGRLEAFAVILKVDPFHIARRMVLDYQRKLLAATKAYRLQPVLTRPK